MGLLMSTDAAIDRVKGELSRAFEKTRADLERVEILAACLVAFSKPVPTYEPRFRHLPQAARGTHELPSD
jgi:hypothetical protein